MPPGGRKSTGPPPSKPNSHGTKRKRRNPGRALDALAIAEAAHPQRIRIKASRLGESEEVGSREGLKRRRGEDGDDDDDDDGDNGDESDDGGGNGGGRGKRLRPGDRGRNGEIVEGGSDGSGGEWVVGPGAGESDSEVDSEEAFGVGDEERFGGFSFGKGEGGVDLDEGEGDGESDGFAEGAVDLAEVLDGGDWEGDDEEGDEEGSGEERGEEEETSELSLSEDEDQDKEEEQQKLASLQALVASMNGQDPADSRPRRPAIDAQELAPPSEFGVQPRRKLTVADLLPSVTDPKLRKSLKTLDQEGSKSSSSKRGIAKKLDVPLPKRQQDKLNRAAAGVKSKEALDEWIDTVKHNRRAEHLSFPLKDPNATVAPGTKRLLTHEEVEPVTELEKAIQKIMKESGLGPANGKSEEQRILEAEELQMNKMPLAEVQLRRAELRRARSLLFREEIRSKRIKKIKSKSFRKVHRKERERNAQAEKSALVEAGVEESEDEKERNDRRRAEERMGARHRESKWAKGVKASGRAMWDDDARDGVTEMARRGEELKKRIEGKEVGGSDDDDDVSSEDVYEDDDDDVDDDERQLKKLSGLLQHSTEGQEADNAGAGGLAGMDFMKKAEAARKTRNDDDAERLRRELAGEDTPSEAEDEEGVGRKSYGPAKQTKNKPINPFSTANKSELEERQTKSDGEEDQEEDSGFQGFEDDAAEETEIIITDKPPKSLTSLSNQTRNRIPPTKESSSQAPPATDLASNPWLLTTDSPKSKHNTSSSRAGAIINNTLPADTEPNTSTVPPASKQQTAIPNVSKSHSTVSSSIQTTTTTTTTNNPPIINNDHPTSDSDSDSPSTNHPLIPSNATLIQRAFAADTLPQTSFAASKLTLERSPSPPLSTTLPGWGAWTGPGLSRKTLKRQKPSRQNPSPSSSTTADIQKKKKDARDLRHPNPNVIVSQARLKKADKYLAKELPFPYETRAQYERGLRVPVGGEWNAKVVVQGMTAPRVRVQRGRVVGAIARK